MVGEGLGGEGGEKTSFRKMSFSVDRELDGDDGGLVVAVVGVGEGDKGGLGLVIERVLEAIGGGGLETMFSMSNSEFKLLFVVETCGTVEG